MMRRLLMILGAIAAAVWISGAVLMAVSMFGRAGGAN